MPDRVKGVKVGIYSEGWDELRNFQDPEGWYVTDIGPNEDEDGYYMFVEARGLGGEKRYIAVSLTLDALNEIGECVRSRHIAAVSDTFTRTTTDAGWGTVSIDDIAWDTLHTTNKNCCGGENCCSPSV